ncbi:MAG: hypothetical protein JWP03_2176 [Phycisphaerales bacterium]|jgi:hypothetical protein|nr:hypothetical protein [Phycisphaerales bacterium]
MKAQMTEQQEKLVAAALEKVFRHYNEDAGPMHKDQRTRDFVFHMTDWYEELVRLSKLYADPSASDQKTWNNDVGQFLYHAVGHLMAAARINDTFVDTFGNASGRKRRSPKKQAKASSVK